MKDIDQLAMEYAIKWKEPESEKKLFEMQYLYNQMVNEVGLDHTEDAIDKAKDTLKLVF